MIADINGGVCHPRMRDFYTIILLYLVTEFEPVILLWPPAENVDINRLIGCCFHVSCHHFLEIAQHVCYFDRKH